MRWSNCLFPDAYHDAIQRRVDHLFAHYLPPWHGFQRHYSNESAWLRLLRDGGAPLMSTRLSTWVSQLKQIGGRRESGQIIVLFAVFVIVLMVLAGSAYDYASIVTDDARLQNAADAALLAGSNSLVANSGQPAATAKAIAQATAQAYLVANGGSAASATITFPT